MSVKIRLKRVGAKKKPSYRVVVACSGRARDGKIIELLGSYNPMCQPKAVNIKPDKVKKWLSNGAQPTKTVKSLFKKLKLV
jgi:small subunit ribosomal protein S16